MSGDARRVDKGSFGFDRRFCIVPPDSHVFLTDVQEAQLVICDTAPYLRPHVEASNPLGTDLTVTRLVEPPLFDVAALGGDEHIVRSGHRAAIHARTVDTHPHIQLGGCHVPQQTGCVIDRVDGNAMVVSIFGCDDRDGLVVEKKAAAKVDVDELAVRKIL